MTDQRLFAQLEKREAGRLVAKCALPWHDTVWWDSCPKSWGSQVIYRDFRRYRTKRLTGILLDRGSKCEVEGQEERHVAGCRLPPPFSWLLHLLARGLLVVFVELKEMT